jgi:hypothetical protein
MVRAGGGAGLPIQIEYGNIIVLNNIEAGDEKIADRAGRPAPGWKNNLF